MDSQITIQKEVELYTQRMQVGRLNALRPTGATNTGGFGPRILSVATLLPMWIPLGTALVAVVTISTVA